MSCWWLLRECVMHSWYFWHSWHLQTITSSSSVSGMRCISNLHAQSNVITVQTTGCGSQSPQPLASYHILPAEGQSFRKCPLHLASRCGFQVQGYLVQVYELPMVCCPLDFVDFHVRIRCPMRFEHTRKSIAATAVLVCRLVLLFSAFLYELFKCLSCWLTVHKVPELVLGTERELGTRM